MSDQTPYERIGGEPVIRALVARFYALMDTLPAARACRAIHPPDLAQAEERLFWYLTGWLGGPPMFVERRGPPMLRRRHLHAPIAGPEIEGWLLCFRQAWAENVTDEALTTMVLPQIEGLAQHMRNRENVV
jgi:hemoglobin